MAKQQVRAHMRNGRLVKTHERDNPKGHATAVSHADVPAAAPPMPVSPHQYGQQLSEILTQKNPTAALERLSTAPETAELFPEFVALNMPDRRNRHKDVLDHTIKVTAKTQPNLETRLAALCHDLGKPPTRKMDGGKVTFHGHENVGAAMTRKVLKRFGYDKQTVEKVTRIVDMSGRFKNCEEWTDSAVRRFDRDAQDVLPELLDMCRADVTSKHRWKHERQQREVQKLHDRIMEVREADAKAAERPDLNGQQVMEILDLKPGPQVGEALNMLLQHRREHGPLERDEAVELLKTWWNENG